MAKNYAIIVFFIFIARAVFADNLFSGRNFDIENKDAGIRATLKFSADTVRLNKAEYGEVTMNNITLKYIVQGDSLKITDQKERVVMGISGTFIRVDSFEIVFTPDKTDGWQGWKFFSW
jgi:hypothetical protein